MLHITKQLYILYRDDFLKDVIYILSERGEGREGGRETSMYERYIDHLPPACPQLGTLARNPGMCPDWESNPLPLGLQASVQSTEPHQPGLDY